MGQGDLAYTPPPGGYRAPMRDTEPQPPPTARLGRLPWRLLGRSQIPLVCPSCGQGVPRHGSRPRRWRHLNTMPWKTFITADVPRVNVLHVRVKQVQVAWACEHLPLYRTL